MFKLIWSLFSWAMALAYAGSLIQDVQIMRGLAASNYGLMSLSAWNQKLTDSRWPQRSEKVAMGFKTDSHMIKK
jgi:hypothetical protein